MEEKLAKDRERMPFVPTITVNPKAAEMTPFLDRIDDMMRKKKMVCSSLFPLKYLCLRNSVHVLLCDCSFGLVFSAK
jgi:hypothetical protein